MDKTQSTEEDSDFPVPNYLRTRKIIVREVLHNDDVYVLIICTCPHFTRKRCQCRHFYALITRCPKVEDFSPECLQSYELFHSEHDEAEYTQGIDEVVDMFESYGGLMLKMSLSDFKEGMREQRVNLSWYQSTFNDIGIDTTPRDSKVTPQRHRSLPDTVALDVLSNVKKQSAYTRTIKSFTECANVAKSEDDVKDMLDTLNDLHGRILGRKNKQSSGNIVHGFPSMETKVRVKRKDPRG